MNEDGKPLPILVVVTGPPASGKSGLAEDLAEALDLPLLTKDGIKETLFDTLGTGDEAWSKRVGEAAWHVLFHALDAVLRGGGSLVAEGNFEPAYANERFAELPSFRTVQVYCHAPEEELLAHFRERAEEGERHPGHAEGKAAEEDLESGLEEGRWAPLEVPGPLVDYRRSDDEQARERAKAGLVERVRALLAG